MFFLLLSFKEVGSARLRESDIHPVNPKTPAPQYQPIDRKKRKGKIVETIEGMEQVRTIKTNWPCTETHLSHTIEYGVGKIVREGH